MRVPFDHVLTEPSIDISFYSKCIHLLNWFDYRNHICLVSELLGMCVYDFLKENDFAPFPRDHIQSFARQLLGSVACMYLAHHNFNSFVLLMRRLSSLT